MKKVIKVGTYTRENIPRIKVGHKLTGPSFYGCFNTGLEPVIRHIQLPDVMGERRGRPRETRYVVGPDLAGLDVARKVFHEAWEGTLNGKRIYEIDKRKVYVYKTRKPAVEQFCSLCNEVVERNNELREAHRKDMEAAQQGDMGAALRLGDY